VPRVAQVFLFGYDIFWVFGTEVMVTVAKGIDAPIKLLFPKDLLAAKLEFSLLGLGDIVIPGIFVAMMLRFDAQQRLRGLPYFRAQLLAYVLALVTTVGVMHVFNAAQPALLYLVPGCLAAAGLTAVARGELGELWKFSEEAAPAVEASEKKGK
jgi:minor histocompatibility antigen H13